MATIAELIIKAVDQATPAFRQVQKSAQDVGKNIKEAFDGMGKIGGDLMGLGAAGLGAFGLAIKGASGFQDELKRTMTMTGTSGSEFRNLEKTVSNLADTMSVKFATDGTEVLKSFYYTLSTGSTAGSEAFTTLSDSALMLSKVIKMDTSEAVESLADTTKIFGKSMEYSAHTADVFFKSSQLGNTTVPLLAQAMREGGKAANALGISMEDTAAMLVGFSNQGVKGAEAGTVLRMVLVRLATPTGEAAQALKSLGINAYDSTGKLRPIFTVLEELRAALSKLTPEAANNVLKVIAGEEAYAKLAGVLKKDVIASMAEWSKKLQESGALTGAFSEIQKTLSFQLGVVWQNLMKLVRVVGDTLLPIVTSAAKTFGEWTKQTVQFVKSHPQLIAGLTKFSAIGALITAALGAALVGISGFVTKAISVVSAIGSVLAVIFSPLGAGIALMVAGIYLAWQQNFGGIRDLTLTVVQVIQEAWGKFWEFMKQGKEEELSKVWQTALDKIKELFGTKFDEIKTKVTEFVTSLKTSFAPVASTIAPVLAPLADALKDVVKAVDDFLTKHPEFVAALEKWGPIIATASGALILALPQLDKFGKAVSVVTGPLGTFSKLLGSIGAFFVSNPLGIALGVFALLYIAWQKDLGGIQEITKSAVDKIKEWWDGFAKWLQDSGIAAKAKEIWDKVSKAISDAFAYITRPEFSSKMQGVITWLQDKWNELVEFFKPTIDALKEKLLPSWQGMWNDTIMYFQRFRDEIWPQLQLLWDDLVALWKELEPIVKPIIEGFLNIIQSLLVKFIGDQATKNETLRNDWSKNWTGIRDEIIPLARGFVKTITDIFAGMRISMEWLANMELAIEKFFRDTWVSLKKWWNDVNKWIEDKFSWLLKKIEEIQRLCNQMQGLLGQSNNSSNFTASDATVAAASSVSGSSGAAGSAVTASRGTTIHIHGNIITTASSMRALEKDLSRYTVQRLARGVV